MGRAPVHRPVKAKRLDVKTSGIEHFHANPFSSVSQRSD